MYVSFSWVRFVFLSFVFNSFFFLSLALFPIALLCFALLCFASLCFALLCFALLCFALLCFALLCFALLEEPPYPNGSVIASEHHGSNLESSVLWFISPSSKKSHGSVQPRKIESDSIILSLANGPIQVALFVVAAFASSSANNVLFTWKKKISTLKSLDDFSWQPQRSHPVDSYNTITEKRPLRKQPFALLCSFVYSLINLFIS